MGLKMILLNSRLKNALLTYVFTHPGEDFYVRELALLIGEDPGNLSRALNKLESEGLFRSKCRGNAKYFSLNEQYPLYPELKKIVLKTAGAVGSLRALVEGFKRVELAFVYGSYARGDEGKSSDIDFVVVGRPPRAAFTKAIRALEEKLNREINFSIYATEEFGEELKKEGSFLNMVVAGKVIVLKGSLDV
jgi:predicted nucleotidyltransferase